MNFVVNQIKWIMLVSGALTCTMIYAAIAPQAAFLSTFGETLQGPAAELVVRNWGVLIALMGALLIYGAFNPAFRVVAIAAAGASKLIFVLLVLSYGGRYLSHQAGIAIAIDAVWIVLFAIYLVRARSA